MIIQNKGDQLELKLTATFKTRVKKLFAIAYELKKSIVTVSDIKRQFPKHNLTKVVSWFDICGTCMEKIEAREIAEEQAASQKPVFTNTEETLMNEIHSYKLYTTGRGTVGGVSYKVGYNNDFLGTIGYCNISNKFYYCSGKNGYNRYVETVTEAVRTLIHVRGYRNLLETVAA